MTAPQYSTNLALPVFPELSDPEMRAEFMRVYNALGVLQDALDRYTGIIGYQQSAWSSISPGGSLPSYGANRLYLQFFEAVTTGMVINVFNFFGSRGARKADAASGNRYPAFGFCTGNYGIGDWGEIILFGLDQLFSTSAANIGKILYLSDTVPGTATITAPGGASLTQALGWVIDVDSFWFNPQMVQ